MLHVESEDAATRITCHNLIPTTISDIILCTITLSEWEVVCKQLHINVKLHINVRLLAHVHVHGIPPTIEEDK